MMTEPWVYMLGFSRTLIVCVSVAFAATLGCSSTYDSDNLRTDGGAGDGADAAAGGADGGGGGASDAAPVPDAGNIDEPDGAPADCGEVGQDCPGGDAFVECTAEGTCQSCGDSNEDCCSSGPPCEGVIGLLCNEDLNLCL